MIGYGRIWEINLSTGALSKKQLSQEIIQQYLGGRGLGVHLLLDYLHPGIDPLCPENVIIFLTGPLTGTPAPGASKYVVITKSPATGGWLESYSSGRLAIELRYAGCDILVIKGKAKDPSYIYINDEAAEIRAAGNLWGMDTFQTEETLKSCYKNKKLGIACIGPAGENLINFASINSDFFRQAGRGGAGAVMGSKNLKAIIAYGTKGVKCKEPNRITRMLAEHVKKTKNNDKVINRKNFGTSQTMVMTNNIGMLPTMNYQKGTSSEAIGKIDAQGVGPHVYHTKGCVSCIAPCGVLTYTKGPLGEQYLEGPEYETLCLLGTNLGVYSLPEISAANIICDKLGLDTISTGNVIGFAMECFERGLIGLEETDGKRIVFTEKGLIPDIIYDIAYRRGFGAKLALGTRALSKEIGRGSERFAIQIKGLEFSAYDPRAAWGGALAYAVSPRGACHRRSSPLHTFNKGIDPFKTEGQAVAVKELYDERSVLHTVLVCDFVGRGMNITPDIYAQYINAVLGQSFTGKELVEMADRVETAIRLFNVREGFARADDTLPLRILEEPLPDGPAKGKVIGKSNLNKMLDEYYKLRGWNNQGIPTKDTLKKLKIKEYGGYNYA